MVQLPKTSPWTAKDQAKSDQATCFIGRGSPGSSTAAYAKAWGDLANKGVYSRYDVVFVSVEGNRVGRLDPDYDELLKALEARATILTDTLYHRSRPYNTGERLVAAYLRNYGYHETRPGRWEFDVSQADLERTYSSPAG